MIRCTIAIPVFNRVGMITDCVASALAQSDADLEVLVVDNHSHDGTWELLQRIADPRLRLVRNERNLGLFGNFNRCLELARGDYLRFLCSDDRLPAGCLGDELSTLAACPEAAMLSGRGLYRDAAGQALGTCGDVLPPGRYARGSAAATVLQSLLGLGVNPLCYPSGILLRRQALLPAGRFDEGLRVAGDVDYFLRVLAHGDLLVSRTASAFITLHRDQIGHQQTARNGFVHLREQLTLLRRHGSAIAACRKRGVLARVAAMSAWSILRCLLRRELRSVALHLAFTMRSRVGPWRLAASLLALLLLRCRYYRRG